MTVKRVEVLAYAKINLMLDIIRRRTDGYHDLFMIMQSVGVADRVTVEREPGRKLRLTASIDDIPLDDKNIAWKAAALFFKTTGYAVRDCIFTWRSTFPTQRVWPAAVQTVRRCW